MLCSVSDLNIFSTLFSEFSNNYCFYHLCSFFYSELSLEDCPKLHTPPYEVVAQGQRACIAYLERLSQGSVACYRTKLMFVGLGGAGKTT